MRQGRSTRKRERSTRFVPDFKYYFHKRFLSKRLPDGCVAWPDSDQPNDSQVCVCMISNIFIQLYLTRVGYDSCWSFQSLNLPPNPVPIQREDPTSQCEVLPSERGNLVSFPPSAYVWMWMWWRRWRQCGSLFTPDSTTRYQACYYSTGTCPHARRIGDEMAVTGSKNIVSLVLRLPE